ncbi:MAG: RNA polymerase sigma factor [Planctomycetota bacterium]|nr:RNA polymerase sigma factor [Planctomycetota bacterium]
MPPDPPIRALLDPELLLERYGERIYRLARRMTNSDADAEDAMQNTLIKILRKADTYRGDSDPMGWIYRITLNEAREIHRRRSRRPAVSLDQLPIEFDESGHALGVRDHERRPDRAAMATEIDERIRAAIDELPDGYREAVVLHDIEGVPYAEAADLLELTLGGFKTRLHRARLHLRSRLDALWSEMTADGARTEDA